ncbi:SEN1 N terminal-domain-containing protein [Tricladium varicosporioides]|nr:SEN1 N terminal-domain-containing protein [Hymenoscyphus varicosporioides]
MKEEAEIMDELHGLDSELKSFPTEAHWFCPRRNDEDAVDYDQLEEAEEDMSLETKIELIEDAKHRQEVAYKFSLILGMAPEIAGRMLDDYTQGLTRLLTGCDKCVRNWHMGRKAHLKYLAEEFDEDTAAALSSRLNTLDFHRIDAGLESGEKLLAGVPATQRTQSLLARDDQAALLALYEALCSVEFHKSDQCLSSHFNYVFSQVQGRKVLRISDILPAMARFLFQKETVRLRFATNAWHKMTSSLTTETFDWVIHDVLSEQIAIVSNLAANPSDIQRFWQGLLLILDKMDDKLITHSLRAMEIQPDIYRLGLQHLAHSSEDIVKLVIEAYTLLLTKAPKDFWSALGTISPATVAEQIFQSPGFEKVLGNKQNFEDTETSPALAWIPVFIQSLESIHQHDACRALLYNLLERLQEKRFSEVARLACCHAGLEALRATLSTFINTNYRINPSTSLIVINDIMTLVDKYKGTIVGCADLDEGEGTNLQLKKGGMLVIQDALTLDCKAMSAEFYALENGTPIQRGLRTHCQSIWQAVLDIFRPGNLPLAKCILSGTMTLTGLDELLPEDKKKPNLPKDHIQYNKDFHQLMDNIARIFERLSDFSSSDLRELYQDQHTARPLFAALVSSNQGVYEATVEVMKAATGHLGKQDAVSGLLESSFVPMLNSLSYAFNRVYMAKTFGPVPYMLKIGREILKALCGNTGLLRSRSFSTSDHKVIIQWWTHQWRALDVVFSSTETWAPRVDKSTQFLQEFCRDGMEYAEALFDEYSVFASALSGSSSIDEEKVSNKPEHSRLYLEKVLDVVCKQVNGLTGLLRLRDSYLVSVITSLLGKLLRCLGEYNLEIDEWASDFIKSACKKENERGFRRTNLTNQQKAELQRALDEHQGVEIIEMPTSIAASNKKQITIDAWSRSADGKRHEPTLPSKNDSLSLNLKSSSARNQEVLERMRAQTAAKTAATDQSMNAFKEKRRKAEEERKRQNAEAIARAKALRQPAGVHGEGSGLKDMSGVLGKDHAPMRSEIMVGSSDEDDSDEDDGGVGSSSLVKKRRETSKMVTEYEESRRRALKQQQGPVKKTKIQRSAKDLRARVEPNMDRLYLEILNWDIFHKGDDPPSENHHCRKIDNKYIDLSIYKDTFGPLLISEVWRSLVTARDENNLKPIEITILNRLSVDKFMEVSTKMPMTKNRDLMMSERDIVLLSKSSDPMNNSQEPHCLARVDRTTRKKDVIEVTYRVSRNIEPSFLQALFPNGKIHAVKIADMTTTQREFAALSSLEYYDLCSEVLEAKPSPLQKYNDDKISNISSKYSLNRGQAKAILSANDNDGFTLIQGPPGSGKTKTIVAMVGALMTPILQQQATQAARAQPVVPSKNGELPKPAGPQKKLLICAPSNAAVDELVLRLKEGIQPLNGPRQKINVIRIGRSDAINASVKDVMLDELVQRKLEGDNGEKNKLLQDRNKLYQDVSKINEQLKSLRPQMEEARKNGDQTLELKLRRQFDELKRNQAHIGSKIDEDKESGNTVSRQNEINRRRFQQEIIDGAHVLCSTLSGSGHDMFRNLNVEFETVVIDEAAQCIELSALIPLKYGCSKCILVGDPEQLPPTVLSRSAQSFGYEQSLFVRMQKNHPGDVHLLDTQYRMHPEISSFPSAQFYNSRLLDGQGMAKLREQPWHASTTLGPYRFFDVEGVQTKEARGHSFINVPELNAAMQLYVRLKTDYAKIDFKGKIGIITTYKAQLNEMKSRFAARFGDDIFEEIEFNTTDAFQGREREIIIFSCVRAKATGGIGFLGDIRRMNVGLTRAKSSLWVLGDSRSLQQGEFWNRLIVDAKERQRYTGGDIMGMLSKPTSRDRPPPQYKNQADGRSSPAIPSNSAATSLVKVEDVDVEMTDAPSLPGSRKSSTSGASTSSKGHYKIADQPLQKTVKSESASLKSENDMNPGEKESLKRRRESIKDEELPPKKAPPAKSTSTPDLDAALRAQMANKPTPAARPRPPGGLPPRRKAPVDPFIQRKPPKRT